ncbi:MAG: Ni/Fe hydrogenase subunit alpha [Nanoarchaeota archaeon]|nr:Ni/Fe hydrogenase subunit alpha [Nanoarchaeota archaeon]
MTNTIKLNHICKIEGHASLTLGIEGKKVTTCQLHAIEGSRYFEGLLLGRQFVEAHEISSRICGICSCGHNIAAIQAQERALGIQPTEQTKLLREILTLGERIRSHATHLYFLALPDYLGYESAIAMTAKFKNEVAAALKLVKLGNDMVRIVGGRVMHQISCTVGGMLKIPSKADMLELRKQTMDCFPDAEATLKLFFGLQYPDFKNESEYFCLQEDNNYAMHSGRIVSKSHTFEQEKYHDFIKEYQEDYATSNFAVKADKPYMVGSLARVNNNFNLLTERAKKMVADSPYTFPSFNPFHNNLAQAIELVDALDRTINVIKKLDLKEEKVIQPDFKQEMHGISAVEVPRGTLWHEYKCNEKGEITFANIVTPTCQNLRNMEKDIRAYVEQVVDLPREKLVLEVEKLIRAYDPCFSCSTHFLKVKWVK